MSGLYDSMTSALREHWKTHNNAYPQRFELKPASHAELLRQRKLVIQTMHYQERDNLEDVFLDVPVVVSDAGDVMVAVDGALVPLSA